MTPLCTIVIPVRNMSGKYKNLATWLPFATKDFFEIIFIDDTSEPLSSNELHAYLSSVPNIGKKVISGVFGNPGISRNIGLKAVATEWVIFWDADDLGHPEVLKSQLSKIREDVDAIIFGFDIRDWKNSNVEIEHSSEHLTSIEQILKRPGLWRICFRTRSLESHKFPEFSMGEDQCFLAAYFQTSRNTKFFDEVVYSYYRNVPDQLTSNPKSIRDLSQALEYLYDLEKTKGKSSLLSEIRIRMVISGLKHGTIRTKVRMIPNLLREVFPLPSKLTVKTFLKVISN